MDSVNLQFETKSSIIVSMTYNELLTVIAESAQLGTEQSIDRSIESELYLLLKVPRPLKAITGLRRSGKSYLLKKMYRHLIDKSGIPPSNILFINFENDRLLKYRNLIGLRNLFDMFTSHANGQKPIYLFLDEIQNVHEWESFVRTVYDSTDYNIFITGSNSHLLSSEFSTSLGGRILEFNIYPFSFSEYLQWNHVPIPGNIYELSKVRSAIQSWLNQYLRFGGLVETFGLSDLQKISYQETLTEKIIVNDILNRFNLKYPNVLKSVGQFLQTNVGNITSIGNMTKWIRNMGEDKKLDYKTVQTYIGYLEKTYLIKKVRKFSLKTKGIFSTQDKYYFVDNLFSHKSDIEDQIENTVFQHLSRIKLPEIFYGRNPRGQEIDFMVADQSLAYQVCYQLNDANIVRESKFPANLIYMYDQRSQKHDIPNIKLTSLDQFLLGIE